ncbi:hypothetical protein H8E88_19900 [candidate division KSB1 bacterium]|nr:hypothetical protein [candidate division KSB1 bacterium]
MDSTEKTTDQGNHKIYAILSYIPFLCFIPLLNYPNIDSFSKKHAKQGFLLLIIEFISLLFLIDFVSKLFWSITFILCLIISVIGIIKASSSKSWNIPLIGSVFEKYEI